MDFHNLLGQQLLLFFSLRVEVFSNRPPDGSVSFVIRAGASAAQLLVWHRSLKDCSARSRSRDLGGRSPVSEMSYKGVGNVSVTFSQVRRWGAGAAQLVSLVLGISCLPGVVEVSQVLKAISHETSWKYRILCKSRSYCSTTVLFTGVRHAFVV